MNQPLQQSGVALPVGHQLLWYEIQSVLGQGGFGITYLAHDKNLGRDVALKEYLPRAWADRQSDLNVAPLDHDHDELYHKGLSSFMTEARTLAKFKHPNIVQVLAVFEQHNTAYIAMEYELGGSLTELLKSKQFVTSEETLKGILIPIIEGLQNVHDLGFLHRDIKPSNIYVRNDGSPVLIDFGSSRQTGQLNTSDVTILITQGYTPPEQYSKGFGDQGPWTDIYSLAASAYHAISGSVVTDALQRNATVQAGQPDPFTPLTIDGFPNYSHAFLVAINDALSLKPEDRPQSLYAWRQILDGGLAKEILEPADEFADDDRTVLHTLSDNVSSTDYESLAESVDSGVAEEPKGPVNEVAEDDRTVLRTMGGDSSPTDPEPLAESVTEVISPMTEQVQSTKTIEQSIDFDETIQQPASTPRKLSKLIVSGLAVCALLAAGAFLLLGGQKSSNIAAPSAGNKTVSVISPVKLLSDDIQRMRGSLATHKRTLEVNSSSEAALSAIDEIGRKFTLLANSQIVQSNRDLAEQVADGLVNSVGVNQTTQNLIIKLIQGPSVEATEDTIETLLAGNSDAKRESLFFGLALAPAETKQKMLASPVFGQLMNRIYTSIDKSMKNGQIDQATRMIELALLLQPEDQTLRAYVE